MIVFRQHDGDSYQVFTERYTGPFDTYLCGVIQRDHEGYYWFHPIEGPMSYKMLRLIADKVGTLNSPATTTYAGTTDAKFDEVDPSPKTTD